MFSFFRKKKVITPEDIAKVAFSYTLQQDLFEDFTRDSKESTKTLKRLENSKHVVVLQMLMVVLQNMASDRGQSNALLREVFEKFYLMINVLDLVKLGDFIVLDEEIDTVISEVYPGTQISDYSDLEVQRRLLNEILFQVRYEKFNVDLMEGANTIQATPSFMLFVPAGKRLLSQLRGIPLESVDFSDANKLGVCLNMVFFDIQNSVNSLNQ